MISDFRRVPGSNPGDSTIIPEIGRFVFFNLICKQADVTKPVLLLGKSRRPKVKDDRSAI